MEENKVPRIKSGSSGKHRGRSVNVWLNGDDYLKLESLSASSGKNRSEVLRALISGTRIKDQSYWKLYSQLASIGGLIKRLFCEGKGDEAWALGEQLVAFARRLEAMDTRGAGEIADKMLSGE